MHWVVDRLLKIILSWLRVQMSHNGFNDLFKILNGELAVKLDEESISLPSWIGNVIAPVHLKLIVDFPSKSIIIENFNLSGKIHVL